MAHATDYMCLLGPGEDGLYRPAVTDLSASSTCDANDDCLCAALTSKCQFGPDADKDFVTQVVSAAMADMCDRSFCVCSSHPEYQSRANERLDRALEGIITAENNYLASARFLECTFGPTKDGAIIKDLIAEIDNDLLCNGQSTQFCTCDEENVYTLQLGKLSHETTGGEWKGQKVSKPGEPEEEEAEGVIDELVTEVRSKVSDEMMIFGGVIAGLLAVVLCLVIAACCRRNKGDLTTVRVEKEMSAEKRALEEYKRRKGDAGSSPGPPDSEKKAGTGKGKKKDRSPVRSSVPPTKARLPEVLAPSPKVPHAKADYSEIPVSQGRLGVTSDAHDESSKMFSTSPHSFVLQQGADTQHAVID